MTQQTAAAVAGGVPDPAVWIQAHGEMAAHLAKFQATKPTARSTHIDDVVEAMDLAFELGFAYSCKSTSNGLDVTLHHSSGWDMSGFDSQEDEQALGSVLAGLLGIRIAEKVQAAQPEQAAHTTPSAELEAIIKEAEGLQAAAAVAASAVDDPVDLIGEGMPDHPVPAEKLQVLSESDRNTCLAMLKALPADARKTFTVAFRDHFNVPRESRTISPFVTQEQHKDFIQNFVDELELQEVAA